uniref:Uncharacterized protein n=1 Tax=Ananas comosus var. bracteatus TaxID=296719 RepID=A0A6V7P3N1_ANACO|nr:unnamed protein product [Ananas comosus var. bracteatus]
MGGVAAAASSIAGGGEGVAAAASSIAPAVADGDGAGLRQLLLQSRPRPPTRGVGRRVIFMLRWCFAQLSAVGQGVVSELDGVVVKSLMRRIFRSVMGMLPLAAIISGMYLLHYNI